MYTKSVLLAALAASTVSAVQLFPGHNVIKRDLELVARQTADSTVSAAEACLTDLASAYASIPTPPADLVSFELTASFTDPCKVTYPASISSELSSYESKVKDWYSSHSAEIASALSECPSYSSSAGLGDTTIGGTCATGAAGGSGGSKTTGGAGGAGTTGTGTAAGGSGTKQTSTNAGPKETAMVGAAALAMAGVLGVVAAL